jgi:hypothetical protein
MNFIGGSANAAPAGRMSLSLFAGIFAAVGLGYAASAPFFFC